ncbi:unnamed protein product [Cylindrotheca closterium]|uniref:Uncharacterized protein n=1 Tax=Cylindrotheca closterium TaxID=2856 RepID=A0AAD2G339_9STRA|nr:unnamed protein product [Cylindrotheca closterium]
MSQRSMMMNYNLPNTNQQFLGTNLGEESAQGMAVGPNYANRTMLSMASNTQTNNSNHQARFQQAACTRVPCQARGMSTDHNALTSYLEIPTDAVHGLHLLCSHPTCRTAGVKFRYCYYCKKPVTKQNFRSRHLHADLAENEKKNTSAPLPIIPLLPASTGGPVCLPASTTSAPPSPPTAQQQTKATLFGNSESTISPRSNLQSLIDAANANKKRPREEPLSNTQQRQWANLLTERPSNMMLTPGWLSKVISTSAPNNPRAPGPFPRATPSPLDQESRWNQLLLERPDGSEDGEKVNTWLVQVLEVSAPTHWKSPASLDSYEGLKQRLNSPSSLSGGNLQQPYLTSDDMEPNMEPFSKKKKM